MDTHARCGEPVPPALVGNLRPSKCRLEIGDDGRHRGDHKAHQTVPLLGKIQWRWKNTEQTARAVRPVIVLPRRDDSSLLKSRVVCTCLGSPHWGTCPLAR